MKLTIISPEKTIYDGNTDKLTVPGSMGPFEILKGHAPIISTLQSGAIVYDTEEEKNKKIDVQSGFVEVSNDNISICVELK